MEPRITRIARMFSVHETFSWPENKKMTDSSTKRAICVVGVAFALANLTASRWVGSEKAILAGSAPREGGASEARLPAGGARGLEDGTFRKEIEALIQPLVAAHKNVGVVVGVVSGPSSLTQGFGVKDWEKRLEPNAQPDGNTLFEIGSLTKAFTATLLAAAAQGGEVRYGDPVEKFLPRSVSVPSFQGRKITLIDLASHTSGLPRMPSDLASSMHFVLVQEDPYASYFPADTFRFLGGYRLKIPPGSRFEYSNLGMGLLGYALSARKTTTYDRLVSVSLCAPLGMKDTGVSLTLSQQGRLARGYSALGLPVRNWGFQETFAGAGALRSTAQDLIVFVRANLELTTTPLVRALAETQAPQFKVDDALSVGMAWMISRADGFDEPVLWHNGETGGYHGFLAFCKKRKTGVVVLTNTASSVDKVGLEILKATPGRENQRGSPERGARPKGS